MELTFIEEQIYLWNDQTCLHEIIESFRYTIDNKQISIKSWSLLSSHAHTPQLDHFYLSLQLESVANLLSCRQHRRRRRNRHRRCHCWLTATLIVRFIAQFIIVVHPDWLWPQAIANWQLPRGGSCHVRARARSCFDYDFSQWQFMPYLWQLCSSLNEIVTKLWWFVRELFELPTRTVALISATIESRTHSAATQLRRTQQWVSR